MCSSDLILAVLGLSCGIWDLLVEACGLLSCGSVLFVCLFVFHILKTSQNQEACISGRWPELLGGVGGRYSGGERFWEPSRAGK